MKISLAIAAAITIGWANFAAASGELLPSDAHNVTKSGALTEFDSTMTPQALDAFYRNALPREGWSTTDDVRNGAALSFYFSRGSQGQGSIVFRARGQNTHVALTMIE
jgi:hypothetical protein